MLFPIIPIGKQTQMLDVSNVLDYNPKVILNNNHV